MDGAPVEAGLVALYTLATLAVPEVLHVNKMSQYLLSVFVAPVLPLPFVSECECASATPSHPSTHPLPLPDSAFNPAVVYALWYVRTRDSFISGAPLQPVQVDIFRGVCRVL